MTLAKHGFRYFQRWCFYIISLLIISQVTTAQAVPASAQLKELNDILFEYEVDTLYPDEAYKGFAQMKYTTRIVTSRNQHIATASTGEEFRIVGVGQLYYEIEFELQRRSRRGFVPRTSVKWQFLSAKGRTEFFRILSRNRIQQTSEGYTTKDLLTAHSKILQGQKQVNYGNQLIKSGETSISVRPITERNGSFGESPGQRLGQKKIEAGNKEVRAGEKLVEEGEQLLEKAQEEYETLIKELSLEFEEMITTAFEEGDYLRVIEVGAMARAMNADIFEAQDYIDAAKKVDFYVSEFKYKGDLAEITEKYSKALAYYNQALRLLPDDYGLTFKIARVQDVISQTGRAPAGDTAEDTTPAVVVEEQPETTVEEDTAAALPEEELVEYRGNKVNAEKLEEVQKRLTRVYDVDPKLTKEKINSLLQPESKVGYVINWEVTVTGYTPKGRKGIYHCDGVEFKWKSPPADMSVGAKVRVVGEIEKIENRKVGKKWVRFYVIKPDIVMFTDDPTYVYY